MFELLCSCVGNKNFWESFEDCSVSKGSLKYYLNKFCKRVKFLAKEKGISPENMEQFARTMSIRKYKIACNMYYDTKSYTEEDKQNGGKHLFDISNCYEWIARQLGVSDEVLTDIRINSDMEFTDKLFLGDSE